MLVKFDADEDLIDALKQSTNMAVASKACHYAATQYLDLLQENARLHQKVAQMRDSIAVYRQIIDSARDAAAMLVERAGQADLFTD
ncbi:hypothetical protein D0C16_03705 [Cellvibrio sp. KY-GH-1]|uniref:hypothetical protein n=1 Tax=Cellvibrio sp. KY-GH-1 TaxID=2303332 RepID=UPI0012476A22|nr:hypothetical protein [Cellvibrio sp. KY-GH-1]QEY15148.1 hypothetical protein D0C16_03680 [Cellvibrio sp. KY-GH-1]QEY15153.1 hypothetical protein D0C16_03705 [Cellvibrio sp. KY-GH-1]